MSYEFFVLADADKDIQSAIEWYDEQQEGLGTDFFIHLDDIFIQILSNPNQFPIIYKDHRRAIVSKYPYVVIYRVVDNKIFVGAITHQRRNPKVWKRKLK